MKSIFFFKFKKFGSQPGIEILVFPVAVLFCSDDYESFTAE